MRYATRCCLALALSGCAYTTVEPSITDAAQDGASESGAPEDASDDDAPRACATECPWECVDGTCMAARQIAVGNFHACALSTARSVHCWGRTLGPAMDGDVSLVPRRVPGLRASHITAGDYHTCVTDGGGNGTVTCWGDNTYGQIGDGTTMARSSPTIVFYGDLFEVVAGNETNWVRTVTGSFAWGANDEGQLGDGSTTSRLSPYQRAYVSGVAAGGHHACANGAGVVQCWGRANWGQLGDGQATHETCTDDVSGPIDCATEPVNSMFPIGSLFAGSEVTCAIDDDRHAWCAGWNSAGQLADGVDHGLCGLDDCSRTPVRVPDLDDVTDIAFGDGTTCFLSAGHVLCAGMPFDDLPHDTCPPSLRTPAAHCVRAPTGVPGITDAVSIAAHGAAFFAIRRDGGVLAWGRNPMGVLGDGPTTDRPTPVAVHVAD